MENKDLTYFDDVVWTIKEGQKIHLRDMTEKHLKSTIFMLYEKVTAEEMTGEFDVDYDAIDRWMNFINAMEKELKRRKDVQSPPEEV